MSDPRSSFSGDPLTEHVVALVQADLPLGAGLRAAAAETSSRKLATAYQQVAAAIDAGQTLDEAIASSPHSLPPNVAALLAASGRSGRLREALIDLVEHDVAARETLRTAYAALAYPVSLTIFAYFCLLFVQWFVVGGLIHMLRVFELDLPPATQVIVSIYEARIWLIIVPLATFVGSAVVLALCKPAWRHRLLASVPLIGKLFHWCGVAQGTRALAHLVQQQVPLPEALQLSSQGLRDANVAEVWRMLARELESGASLSRGVARTHRLPASLVPLIAWGEQTGSLAEALFMASEMLEGRVRLRAQLIRMVLPPIMFIMIAGGAYFHVAALFVPMVSLIQNLSG